MSTIHSHGVRLGCLDLSTVLNSEFIIKRFEGGTGRLLWRSGAGPVPDYALLRGESASGWSANPVEMWGTGNRAFVLIKDQIAGFYHLNCYNTGNGVLEWSANAHWLGLAVDEFDIQELTSEPEAFDGKFVLSQQPKIHFDSVNDQVSFYGFGSVFSTTDAEWSEKRQIGGVTLDAQTGQIARSGVYSGSEAHFGDEEIGAAWQLTVSCQSVYASPYSWFQVQSDSQGILKNLIANHNEGTYEIKTVLSGISQSIQSVLNRLFEFGSRTALVRTLQVEQVRIIGSEPGVIFGEHPLLGIVKYNAEGTVLSPTELTVIDQLGTDEEVRNLNINSGTPSEKQYPLNTSWNLTCQESENGDDPRNESYTVTDNDDAFHIVDVPFEASYSMWESSQPFSPTVPNRGKRVRLVTVSASIGEHIQTQEPWTLTEIDFQNSLIWNDGSIVGDRWSFPVPDSIDSNEKTFSEMIELEILENYDNGIRWRESFAHPPSVWQSYSAMSSNPNTFPIADLPEKTIDAFRYAEQFTPSSDEPGFRFDGKAGEAVGAFAHRYYLINDSDLGNFSAQQLDWMGQQLGTFSETRWTPPQFGNPGFCNPTQTGTTWKSHGPRGIPAYSYSATLYAGDSVGENTFSNDGRLLSNVDTMSPLAYVFLNPTGNGRNTYGDHYTVGEIDQFGVLTDRLNMIAIGNWSNTETYVENAGTLVFNGQESVAVFYTARPHFWPVGNRMICSGVGVSATDAALLPDSMTDYALPDDVLNADLHSYQFNGSVWSLDAWCETSSGETIIGVNQEFGEIVLRMSRDIISSQNSLEPNQEIATGRCRVLTADLSEAWSFYWTERGTLETSPVKQVSFIGRDVVAIGNSTMQ